MGDSKLPTFVSLKREEWDGYKDGLSKKQRLQHAAFVSSMSAECQFSAEARDEFLRDRLLPTPKFEELITKAKVEGISTDVQEDVQMSRKSPKVYFW